MIKLFSIKKSFVFSKIYFEFLSSKTDSPIIKIGFFAFFNFLFILLIGTNPRHEATIVNARIRKAFVKNKTPVYSIGNPGDLTYDYISLGDEVNDIKNIFDEKSEINQELKKVKKPIFIIGESVLELKNSKYILEKTKDFLIENNFINETWNALNILIQNASTVGAIDLGFYNIDKDNNFIFFDKLKNKEFKLLYLVGSDNLGIEKKSKNKSELLRL